MKGYTVICGLCEAEWDADTLSPLGPCPQRTCGYVDEDGDHNVMRDERAFDAEAR